LHTFLAFGSNALRKSPYVQGNDIQQQQVDPFRRRQERPPGVHQPDPFQVLGLNPDTATEKDVRRIQQGAAAMWHEDKGGGPEAQQRLGEINAAAEACLRAIRSRSNHP
jgi:DnaJ-class molecular chaperone